MKAGIIGYGSIGTRHSNNIISAGVTEITLLRTGTPGNPNNFNEVRTITELIAMKPDFVVLSNPTALHYQSLLPLLQNNVNVFCEKPIVITGKEISSIADELKHYKGLGMSGFNLRFHPAVREVKEILQSGRMGKVYSSRFFVGQYLPDWRPGRDYSEVYSAKKELGGGVVLDLIHEIDLAYFLYGKYSEPVASLVGKVSGLKIETEDLAEISYKAASGVFVSIHLDYLYRGYRRDFEIICEHGNVYCDLFKPEVRIFGDKNELLHRYEYEGFERNTMYLTMMNYYLDCLKKGTQPVPSLEDGLVSSELAEKIKNS